MHGGIYGGQGWIDHGRVFSKLNEAYMVFSDDEEE